jgi:hypothetical protein
MVPQGTMSGHDIQDIMRTFTDVFGQQTAPMQFLAWTVMCCAARGL